MRPKEDVVYEYVLRNFDKDEPSFAKDVSEKTGIPLIHVCVALLDMLDEDIVARRRNGSSWEYFLIKEIEYEEYMAEKEANRIISKRFGALGTNYSQLKARYDRLKKNRSNKNIQIQCSCGNVIELKMSSEVVDDNSS